MDLQSLFIIDTYFSHDELIDALNAFADSQGYAVVKQQTKKSLKINEIVKIYFCCDRDGKSKDIEQDRKRKHIVNRLIKCLFSCFALNKVNVS